MADYFISHKHLKGKDKAMCSEHKVRKCCHGLKDAGCAKLDIQLYMR